VRNDRGATAAVIAAPEAAAAAISVSGTSASSSLVPSVSWFGRAASSTVHGAHISVAIPPAAAGASSGSLPQGSNVSFVVTSTFAPPAGAFTWAIFAGATGVVASGTTTTTTSPFFSAGVYATLSQRVVMVEITEEMSPAATLLVFSPYDGEGGEAVNIVAAQVSFKVHSQAPIP